MLLGSVISTPVKEARKAPVVNKSISFAVYKGNAYTSKVYDNTSAQVKIVVEKVSKKGTSVVWDTALTSLLKDYASVEKAQYKKIMVPVNACTEHLEVKYTLIYNSKGNELQVEYEAVAPDNETKLDINI
jgi:N-acetylglucosamine kinase-like BadF-type ATPase